MHAHDPFGRPAHIPAELTREGRVALLAEASVALLRGELPPIAVRLFLGGALAAWLSEGGDLCRDFFRVSAPRGSHMRPERIAEKFLIADERQRGESLED